MDARAAKQNTDEKLEAIGKQLKAEKEEARRKQEELNNAILTHEFTPTMQKIYDRIREAKGYYTYFDIGQYHHVLIQPVVKELREKGYIVSHKFIRQERDYGDFNAPCVVTEEFYRIEISWKHI